MSFSNYLNQLRTGFVSSFWVANVLELFERLAFYGQLAVLVVFIKDKVGLEDAGTLTGWFTSSIYLLPLVAGVFVDKYGFRRTLMACFLIFTLGYFAVALAGMSQAASIRQVIGARTYLLMALCLTAIGGSLIKPCIVGTVAHTTTEEKRSLGYSIYYTLVNLGGSIGPMLALAVRTSFGIEYVLLMSSATTFLSFLGTFLFFKEPRHQAESGRSLTEVFADMSTVFANVRFMVFLIIFSGFWLMFYQIFYLLPFYAKDVLHFEKFELLETVDAWAIIVLTIPMTAFAKKLSPIQAILVGFALSSASWFIIGSVSTVVGVVLACFLFAVGEALQSPRYYEYISLLAPPHQVGTYMGFAFLPIAIGSLAAGYLADWLRINYLISNPQIAWYIVGIMGVVTTAMLWGFNSFTKKKSTV